MIKAILYERTVAVCAMDLA